MNLAHKILLYPNKSQEIFLNGCSGTNRFTWNWILDKFKNKSDDEKISIFDLKKEFNKNKEDETPWMYDYPKDCNQNAFRDFQTTLTRVKKKISKFPKFKSKHNSIQSFYISNDKFKVTDNILQLSKKVKIKMAEEIRFFGKMNGLRVVKENNKWYACFSLEGDFKKDRIDNGTIGIDLGIKTFCFDSNGNQYNLPSKLEKIDKRIRRKQRQISKSIKGSKNRNKKKVKLNKLYEKLKNTRKDFLHKLSTRICSENQTIKIEDLNVSGMTKNHNLARKIQDSCFRLFREMLKYKSELYDNQFIVIDRFFASTKTCSKCGNKKDMKLSDRTYECSCGNIMDRDFNAALNIKNFIPVANGDFKPVNSLDLKSAGSRKYYLTLNT